MSVLTITDGTTTIDLLSSAGFKLSSWEPAYQSDKGGGVWSDSGLAHGGALVMAKESDLEDSFELVARHTTTNSYSEGVGDLARLLEQAKNYWATSWQAAPVYITLREPNETNTRYAIIKGYRLAGYAGPFGRETITTLCHAMHKLALTIIHGAWQSQAIGTDEDLEASAIQNAEYIYGGTYYPTESADDAHVNEFASTILLTGDGNNAMRVGDESSPTADSGNYAPAAGTDDCYVGVGYQNVYLTQNYLALGGGTLDIHDAGIRFALAAAIPANATITSAYMRFAAYGTNYATPVHMKIRGENNAAPATFSTSYAAFRDRVRTAAVVPWHNLPAWTAGNNYDTPDLSTIVQAIITAHGAVNHLGLFVETDVAAYAPWRVPTNTLRRPCSEEDAGVAPTLYVTWTTPDATNRQRHFAIRFRSLNIPLGATILSAYLRLYSTAAEATSAGAVIRCETATSPATFSTYANFMARMAACGSQRVKWTIPAWALTTWYNSPDIKAVLQQYVDTWAGAAATEVAIFVKNNGSVNVMKRPASWDETAHKPRLIVQWADGTGTTFGRSASKVDEIFVANKCNQAQLTHVWWYDASTATYQANKAGVATHDITPNPPADADMVYFGITSIATHSGPFCNLVFNVTTAATYTVDAYCFWEYWSGAAWTALIVSDDTVAINGATYYGAAGGRPWGRLGAYSVVWEQPSGWATTEINAVTAWWVRCRITPGAGAMTVAAQGARPIYSVLWNDVQVQAAIVRGDLPLRGRIRATAHTDSVQLNALTSRLIVGTRTTARADSELFDSFINLSDVQSNGSGDVSPGVFGGFTGASGTMTDAPTGRWIRAVVPAAANDIAATVNLISRAYEGTFHVYLRYIPTLLGVAASWPLYARLHGYFGQWKTAPTPLYNAGTDGTTRDHMYIADLGVVRLHGMTPMKPQIPPLTRVSDTPTVYLYLENPTAAPTTVDLIDLVFMPADEWLGDCRVPFAPTNSWPWDSLGSLLTIGKYLDADSARMPYYHTMTVLRNGARAAATNDTLIYTTSASDPVTFQANAEQNLHFLAMIQAGASTGDALWRSYPYPLFSIQLGGVRRYVLARGTR